MNYYELTIIRPPLIDTICAVPTVDNMPWLMPQAVDSGISRRDLMRSTLCR